MVRILYEPFVFAGLCTFFLHFFYCKIINIFICILLNISLKKCFLYNFNIQASVFMISLSIIVEKTSP